MAIRNGEDQGIKKNTFFLMGHLLYYLLSDIQTNKQTKNSFTLYNEVKHNNIACPCFP
jgi:hypothetical protein